MEYNFEEKSLSRQMSVKRIAESRPKYISTGFDKLDKLLNGGLTPDLYVLGAVSSLGKSTFLLQIAENISAGGVPVLYFSLEMPIKYISVISVSRQIFKQTDRSDSSPGISDLLNSDRKLENDEHVKTAVEECKKRTKGLYIIERDDLMSEDGSAAFGADTICEYTERFIDKHEGKQSPVVVVDYLQLLRSEDSAANYSERSTVDRNITQLWNLAHRLDIPVVVISSVGRENYEKAIGIGSFKESGGIEFSADVVLGMQFPNAGEKGFNLTKAKAGDLRELDLVVLKNRYGASSVKDSFRYYPAHGFFEEYNGSKDRDEPAASNVTLPKNDYNIDLVANDPMFKGE